MKRRLLISLSLSCLLFSGCASMETHTQSFIKASDYEKTMSAYEKLERKFLTLKKDLLVSRLELEKDFPCLKPKRIKIYEIHVEPTDDPLPSHEVTNQPAALVGTGRSELWHMKNPMIGFHEWKEEDAPFLVAILCPVYIEQHYSQGPVKDLTEGKKENRRGVLLALVFTFERMGVTEINNGWQKLVNVRKVEEIPTTDVRVSDDWYTRWAMMVGKLVFGGQSALQYKVP